MAKRRRREYLIYLDKAIVAAEAAIDAFNRVHNPYRNETTLMLLSNSWELLAKAALLQAHKPITQRQPSKSISAEVAVSRLESFGFIDRKQAATIQQIVSLRNVAVHQYLPEVPDEIIHHLLYFGCGYFRELIKEKFPRYSKGLEKNYLSLSFGDLTTYAHRVQKLVSRIKKNKTDKRLVWLLERGIRYDGRSYITEAQFVARYNRKRKVMPYLEINKFIKENEMVRIIPTEAPKNYSADITLRKGSAKDSSLPVHIKKTNVDQDYPYLTTELATMLGTNRHGIIKLIKQLNLKNNSTYHQAIRTSKSGCVHRYSEAAKEIIADKLKNP